MSANTPSRTVSIEPGDWQFEAPAGVSLLLAARAAGVALPSSCRNGTCRTCMCSLVSGQVAYSIEWPGLSAEEKAAGWILPCVAHASSDVRLRVPGAQPLQVPLLQSPLRSPREG
jgi:ferredoxin